jgi:hypothetical protein
LIRVWGSGCMMRPVRQPAVTERVIGTDRGSSTVSQPSSDDVAPERPSPTPRGSGRLPDWLRPTTVGRTIAAVVTTGAALVAIATGVVELRSRIEADPGRADHVAEATPSDSGGVSLVGAALEERQVDLGDGLLGHRVSYTLEYRGGPHQIALAYALFDPERLRRIQDPLLDSDVEYNGHVEVDLPAGNGRFTGQIAVPIPLQGQCVMARVYLLDDELSTSIDEPWGETATRLDYTDTLPCRTHSAEAACETPTPTAAPS